jgi:Trp operon repressor
VRKGAQNRNTEREGKVNKLLTMNEKELTRLDIMKRLAGKSMHQTEAAQQLGISVRQVKRIWRAYREGGAEELISRSSLPLVLKNKVTI